MAPQDDVNLSKSTEILAVTDLRDRLRMGMRLIGKTGKLDDSDQDWMTNIMPYLDVHSARMPSSPSSSSSSSSSSSPSPSSPDFAGPEFPTATFDFTVQPAHANRLANLHGGCAATLFDYCTSVALILVAGPGRWQYLGVTRNLNCTYLRPVPVGTEVLIECEVVSAGRQLALIRGVMRRKSDGAVLNTCEHGKFNTDPPAKI